MRERDHRIFPIPEVGVSSFGRGRDIATIADSGWVPRHTMHSEPVTSAGQMEDRT